VRAWRVDPRQGPDSAQKIQKIVSEAIEPLNLREPFSILTLF
jgi:hypothetical protein